MSSHPPGVAAGSTGSDGRVNLVGEGRSIAMERILSLVDEGTFIETEAYVQHRSVIGTMNLNRPLGDGVVTGHGKVGGRAIVLLAQEPGIFGGSMGEMHARRIASAVNLANRTMRPIVAIWDGEGQRVEDGVPALGATGEMLDSLASCSGRIPTISVIIGTVAGASALAAGLSDFVILEAERGRMFMRSPWLIPEIASGELDEEELGGAKAHSSRSGVACLVAEDEGDAFDLAMDILSFLPDHTEAVPPRSECSDDLMRECPELNDVVPDDVNRPYDMRDVIENVVDDSDFLELFPDYAENIVIGFARMGGRPVGVVGNQPSILAGCLDIDASVKASRFIRTCDVFNLPLITFVDVPGFLPGTVQEWGGIIRHGAKLLYAYAEATVPKLTVVTRKAYGGAYLAMSCKNLRSDVNLAWPSGELAVMGAEGAVRIIHRRDLKEAENPEEEFERLVEEYKTKFGDPYTAARHGWVDDVIEPRETRARLIGGLLPLDGKREELIPKKHGNIPL